MTTATTPVPSAYAGLLREVCERPHDDDVRLVLADWLEDNGGEARAEFIRVQCELWRRRNEYDSYDLMERGPSYTRLEQRERLLFVGSGYYLWNDLPGLWSESGGRAATVYPPAHITAPTGQKYMVRRGFVDEVHATAEQWERHGPSLVACQPVTRVVVTDLTPEESHVEGDGSRVWCLWKPGHCPSRVESSVPQWLWPVLVPPDGAYPIQWDRITVSTHPSASAARDAICAAALAWARREAKLPPLEAAAT